MEITEDTSVDDVPALPLDGWWAEGTVRIEGTSLLQNGAQYAITDQYPGGFNISNDYEGGSATHTDDEIKWANGAIFKRHTLDGVWAEGTVVVTGNDFIWNGNHYTLSNVTNSSFQITGGFGGGSATYHVNEIKWANNAVFKRVSLDGMWALGTVHIAGSTLTWHGKSYKIHEMTKDSLSISNGYGGGEASYTPQEIIWKNGEVITRSRYDMKEGWVSL